MALEPTAVGVLAGIVLGLRFKVLILVPALAAATLYGVVAGIARDDHFWSIVWTVIVLGIAIQVGYFAGIFIRAAITWIASR